MKLCALLLAAMLCTLCVGQASALEYTMNAPDDYLFGRPTSDDTIYEWDDPNVDRSKNTALIPPTFGSPTSYLPGSGTPLTPNLIPGDRRRAGHPNRRRDLSNCRGQSRWKQWGRISCHGLDGCDR